MKEEALISILSECVGKLEISLQLNPYVGVGLVKEALFGLQIMLKELGGD